MQRVWWIAIVAGALLSDGCDECYSSDSYCEGNVLHACESGGHGGTAFWHVEDCEPKYCVEIDGAGAQCALEPEPRAACASEQTDLFACDGGERLLCSHGFVVSIEACPSSICEPDINKCVARAGIDATCQQLPTPVSGVAAGYCDGETATRCGGSYVIELEDCASKSMQCYELQPGVYPVCVASDTPDSRCGQLQGVYSQCNGNDSVMCANDRLISSTTCSGMCELGFCH